MKTVLIIGAGPAGLMAGITAAERGLKVIIIEKNHSAGLKFLATGNGRCNITNLKITEDNFYSDNSKRSFSIYKKLDNKFFLDFLHKNGILTINENNRIYPRTEEAQSILDMLILKLKNKNADILFRKKITDIYTQKNKFIAETAGKEFFEADSLIITTGGKSYPNFGSTGDGYVFAEKFNHKIITPRPALTAVNLKPHIFFKAQGVRTKASILINNKIFYNDDLIITKYGLSGILTFKASSYIGELLEKKKNVSAAIDFFPEINKPEVIENLKFRWAANPHLTVKQSLTGLIRSKLIQLLCETLQISDETEKSEFLALSIAELLKNWKVNISSLQSFEYAQITAGGVSMNEVSDNLESVYIKNLFFAGEILNVHGDCGGYNLQFAFSSGFTAGSYCYPEKCI